MSELVAIAALLVASCGPPCPAGGATPAVTATSADPTAVELADKAEKLADEVCACPDTACAESVSTDLAGLLRQRDKALVGDPSTRVLAAVTRLLECRDRLSYPSEPVDMDAAGPGDGSGAGSPASTGGSG